MAIGKSVGDEIREERRKAMSRMNTKEKFAYFWDYYKIHALVAALVVAAGISLVYHYVTYKDYGFNAVLLNFRNMPPLTRTNMKSAWIHPCPSPPPISPNIPWLISRSWWP